MLGNAAQTSTLPARSIGTPAPPPLALPADRWAAPAALLVLAFLALQTTVANLPANKIFVGHDSGFYNLVPQQLMRTSSGSWEVKLDFGFANFEALLTLPYALLVAAFNALGLGGAGVGRAFYLLELLVCGFGTFALSWIVVRRALPTTRPLVVAAVSAGAAVFASYNILTAVLLLYPPSTFQLGLLLWPGVVAAALAVLWYRPTIGAGLLFGLLCAFVTIGNPAHTMLGFTLVAAIFAVDGIVTGQWKLRPAIAALTVLFGVMAFMWLPLIATRLLYKGSVAAFEAGDPDSLARSDAIISARTSFSNLLHLDGLVWWPRTRNAGIYAAPTMVLLTAVPAILAFVALRVRAPIVKWIWLAAVIGLFFAKSIHPPLPLNLLWLERHFALFVPFREHYDKFVQILLVTLPPLFAIGAAALATSRRRVERWAAVAALIAVASTAWPFLAGRVAEPTFLTTVPDDYRTVDGMLGESSRALSLPGAPGNIYIASWFKGSNFENLLFRAHVVNAAMFKELPISSATLYDDEAGIQAEELPRLVGAMGMYGFDHILLHKDYLTSYRMAWDYERYKVLGPLTALSMEEFLDADPRLVKQFEGPDLVLYRIRPEATLGHAYATSDATLVLGYEDVMLPLSDAGLTAASEHPFLLFLGNQALPTDPGSSARYNETLRLADKLAVALPVPETPGLYRQQFNLPAERFEALGPRYLSSRSADAFVFAVPHGDFMIGAPPPHDNFSGRFTLRRATRLSPVAEVDAERVPTEVTAQWFGTESGQVWPVSSYADEPVPDDDLVVGARPPRVSATFVPPTISIGLNRASAVYQIQLHADGLTPEVAVAGASMAQPVPLLEDPRITLGYEISDPTVLQVFLRAVLRRDDGRTVYLDRELDGSGVLEDWALRDAAQEALDNRFTDTLWLHQTDPLWVASQKYFNAEQAESYKLEALRIVFGKRDGLDVHLHPGTYSVVLRSLRIALNGAPSRSYVDRGLVEAFGSGAARTVTNLPSHTENSRDGALIINAVVSEQTEGVRQPLVGRSVTFRLTDGSTLVGDVVRDTADGYVVQLDVSRREVVAKSAVAAIVATGPAQLRKYSATLRLRSVDIARYPDVHVRYWIGTSGVQPDISFMVDTPAGPRVLRVNNGANDAADVSIPDQWVQRADFPGFGASLTLDGRPSEPARDSGWREAVFDLRELAAQHTGFVRVRPLSVTVTMSMSAGPNGSVSGYAFGFGDVAFTGGTRTMQQQPSDVALVVDGRSVLPTSQHRSGDLVSLRYPDVDLPAGLHLVSTRAGPPWSVASASFRIPPVTPSPEPRLTLRHIDDELYSVHLDGPGPAWIAFAETFHSGWRLLPAAAPPNRVAWLLSFAWLRAPVPDHVVGNGFNNAWHVDGSGPRDYVIDFAPQDFVRIGEAVSIVVVILGLLGAGLAWRRF